MIILFGSMLQILGESSTDDNILQTLTIIKTFETMSLNIT